MPLQPVRVLVVLLLIPAACNFRRQFECNCGEQRGYSGQQARSQSCSRANGKENDDCDAREHLETWRCTSAAVPQGKRFSNRSPTSDRSVLELAVREMTCCLPTDLLLRLQRTNQQVRLPSRNPHDRKAQRQHRRSEQQNSESASQVTKAPRCIAALCRRLAADAYAYEHAEISTRTAHEHAQTSAKLILKFSRAPAPSSPARASRSRPAR